MRLYTAAGKDRAMSYAGFFLFYMVHIAFCVWSAVAPPFWGNSFAGLLTLIDVFPKSKGVGVRAAQKAQLLVQLLKLHSPTVL